MNARLKNGIHKLGLAGVALGSVAVSGAALAHHGVAGLGVASLEGPGAPIEAATSSVLPQGQWLAYLKLDHAQFKTYDPADDTEGDYAQFWMAGVGYGWTPWLSTYLFVPYHSKVDEPGAPNSHGFADVSLFGQMGFKYDAGWQLLPANESLDDLEDWHFTLFGGLTLPTGNANLRLSDGSIDPGKSTGFGEPSYGLGVTATRMFASAWTFNLELSYLRFLEHEYADGVRVKFGDEKRVNAALVYRAFTDPARKLRVDAVLETQYLGLGRDEAERVGEAATGGDIYYAMPGVRVYWDRYSLGAGVKTLIRTRLNEESEQQGAEGKEDYRLVLSFSALF